MPRTLDVNDFINPERLATQIAEQYTEWENLRRNWVEEKQEIRDYIFATDTRSTTNASLPWKNSTHIPKICQIRDNLHANYMAALFPNDRAFKWEGDDENAEAFEKRRIIEFYMENKLRLGGFRSEVSKCVLDYIDYGMAIAMTEFVAEQNEDAETGEIIPGFVGPRLVRLSPLDVVFDPTAASFDQSPKIVRTLKTIGSLKADIEDHPEMGYMREALERSIELRGRFSGTKATDYVKNSAYQFDGFSSFLDYFQSDYVEVLEYYGNIYDTERDEFHKNHVVTIIDQSFVIRKQPIPSWLGKAPFFFAGWRQRPDNLYPMGPLDNLIGMQYRIDHLENAKADAFDLIIHPVMKLKGYIEDFDYEPGARIYTGDDGDVEFLRPDVTMLNADTQIAIYEAKMEEMAGAPKQAMGFRTPGEKTAYEVQVLENGANRIFLNKSSYFEETFLELALNSMLEQARRNMGPSDVVRVVDDQYGAVTFQTITREDIAARGKIRPIGARRFARNANILQNLTQFFTSPLGQDPTILAHFSGKKLARVVEELLDLERYDLVQDNVRLMEMQETAALTQSAQQVLAEQGAAPSGPTNSMVPAPQAG